MPGPPEPEGTGNWPDCVCGEARWSRKKWLMPSSTRDLGILTIFGRLETSGPPRATWLHRPKRSRTGDWKQKKLPLANVGEWLKPE
eukprot:4689116-Heterocapsa_arctica.AAC.1